MLNTASAIDLKTSCSDCGKKLAFSSILRHQKTVHKKAVGKIWKCEECDKICQNEKRLSSHKYKHQEDARSVTNNQFHCDVCPYRTIVKAYLGDHIRLMHRKEGNAMWMCAFGRCATKPVAFPNQKRLDKHKTCHTNAKCDVCGKIFSAKRNIVRHKKNVHESASTNSEGDGENGDRQDPLQQALESDNFIDMVIE